MKVYKAINKVQSALAKEGISKDRTNTQGASYKFRGIDDVFNALSPLLAEHQLCILPRVISRQCVERLSKQGGNLFYVTVEAEFDFISTEDGSKHIVKTFGEAMDSGDKATNKAMSAAYKYAALQAFAIPTEGDNDADAHTHEVKPVEKPKAPPVPDIVVPEGMTILEFTDKMFTSIDTLEDLQSLFKNLYRQTKSAPEEQIIIKNLYDARKAELSK